MILVTIILVTFTMNVTGGEAIGFKFSSSSETSGIECYSVGIFKARKDSFLHAAPN